MIVRNMTKQEKSDLKILIKNYRLQGFDVKIEEDTLVVSKQGIPDKRVSISLALKILNSFTIV
jgi:hypothetical protein